MKEEIIKQLEAIQEKQIKLIQEGFIKSQLQIEKLKFSIENDILTIKDELNGNYIKINTNQIYNIESNANEIIYYIDNDTKIIFGK